jgi:hypothetical protein
MDLSTPLTHEPGNAAIEVEPASKEIGIQCSIEEDLHPKVDCGVQTYVPLHERYKPEISHEENDNPCLGIITFKCPSNCKNIHIVKCEEVNKSLNYSAENASANATNQNGKCNHSFKDFVTTDKKLHKLTGLKNFQILNDLVEQYDEIKKSKGCMKADSKIILLFVKLRHNLPFSVLSILFNISDPTAKSTFVEALQICEDITNRFLYWPSKSEVLKNIPNCFNKFPKVRVVLDATEIKTTRTKCIICHCKCYSHYKGCYTCKFLLGVTPAGMFSFVSKSYGGRVSDKTIFEQSNLILKFDPHSDEIMVDKGVAIRKICEKHGVGLVHPPFLKQRAQLSKPEAQNNVGVAAARVHVERAIERVKKFKIFKDTMAWSLTKYSGSMMNLVCAMVNMSRPILANDKFHLPIQSSSKIKT